MKLNRTTVGAALALLRKHGLRVLLESPILGGVIDDGIDAGYIAEIIGEEQLRRYLSDRQRFLQAVFTDEVRGDPPEDEVRADPPKAKPRVRRKVVRVRMLTPEELRLVMLHFAEHGNYAEAARLRDQLGIRVRKPRVRMEGD